MAVANKVHKQGLQHHAPSHITMHPYISSSSRSLQIRIAEIFVGMHGYVGRCIVQESCCLCTLFATANYLFVSFL